MKTEKQVKKLLENYQNNRELILSRYKSSDDSDMQSVFLGELHKKMIEIKLLKLLLGLK